MKKNKERGKIGCLVRGAYRTCEGAIHGLITAPINS
jgi:hypothetical protein